MSQKQNPEISFINASKNPASSLGGFREKVKAWTQSLSQPFYRRMLELDPNPSANLRIKIASTREELESAYRLAHEHEVRAGLARREPDGLALIRHYALPEATTVIAKWSGEVIGTVTLLRANVWGLPLNVKGKMNHLKRVGEMRGLGVAPAFKNRPSDALFPLIKFIYGYSRRFVKLSALQVVLPASEASILEGLFFFKRMGRLPNGSILLVSDIEKSSELMRQHFSALPLERNLHEYMDRIETPNFLFPERPFFSVSDPVMTPDLLDHFFNRMRPLFQGLSEWERLTLRWTYNFHEYLRVLPRAPEKLFFSNHRKERRYSLACDAQFYERALSRFMAGVVYDVSAHGFQAELDREVKLGECLKVSVSVGPLLSSTLEACPVRRISDKTYGFDIRGKDGRWEDLLQFLEGQVRHLTSSSSSRSA